MNFPLLKKDKLTFFYDDLYNAEQSYVEIFEEKVYDFKTSRKRPFIIDCGSNIGLSAIFFKRLYPDSEILCFEPTPIAFKILQENINLHKLENVTAINGALSKRKGKVKLYGELFSKQPNTSGNSIIADWGDRGYTDMVEVKSLLLSDFINREIDFLKLDIEGAEQQVLEEIVGSNKIRFIREIALEIHCTKKLKNTNNRHSIKKLLKDFKIVFCPKEAKMELPARLDGWINQTGACLYSSRAFRRE